MGGKELTRNECLAADGDAEEGFLGVVQALHVDRIYLEVRIDAHPVVADGKQDERQQGNGQLAGSRSYIE